jgi:hypothetical protein
MTRKSVLLLTLWMVPVVCVAQSTLTSDEEFFGRDVEPRRKTVDVTFGTTFPASHQGMKEFWMQGPAGNVCFLFKTNERTRFGLGLEASLYSFRIGTFVMTFPGVEKQISNLSTLYLYIALRHYGFPRERFSPFIGAELGVLRSTGVEYKAVVDGVRKTYYDIPGIARMAGSVSTGLDFYVYQLIALQLQGRATYVLNDPNIGLLVSAQAGLKYVL